MQFCPVCGKENDEQAPFCYNCRALLPDGSTIGAQPNTDRDEHPGDTPRGGARPIQRAALILTGIVVLLGIFFVYIHAARAGMRALQILDMAPGLGHPAHQGRSENHRPDYQCLSPLPCGVMGCRADLPLRRTC
jgi:hypothetical protein